MFSKHVENFRNVIYLVEQTHDGNVRLTLDYQLYFLPSLVYKDHTSNQYSDFAERGLHYFQNEFIEFGPKGYPAYWR